jgi:hypothetical protein
VFRCSRAFFSKVCCEQRAGRGCEYLLLRGRNGLIITVHTKSGHRYSCSKRGDSASSTVDPCVSMPSQWRQCRTAPAVTSARTHRGHIPPFQPPPSTQHVKICVHIRYHRSPSSGQDRQQGVTVSPRAEPGLRLRPRSFTTIGLLPESMHREPLGRPCCSGCRSWSG